MPPPSHSMSDAECGRISTMDVSSKSRNKRKSKKQKQKWPSLNYCRMLKMAIRGSIHTLVVVVVVYTSISHIFGEIKRREIDAVKCQG